MNRTIKFRAWDKESKKMLDWYTWHEEICQAIPIDCGDEWSDQCEVMQYTGLKDSKGVEIYEGDIVKFDGHTYEDKFTASIIFKEGKFIDSYYGYDIGKYREIIGNIYETPDLLKQQP